VRCRDAPASGLPVLILAAGPRQITAFRREEGRMDRYHEKLGRARAALFWVALAIVAVAWVIARLAPAP